jgi:FixJ family two-component response regulator
MITDPILLVDDEDDLRTNLKEALTWDGYLVEEAASAPAALALMAHRHFPVVLTDLNMPGGPTGLDLIAAVKARDPGTLCVVFTGYASMETAIRAVKLGAYDFVQKPFKLAEIEAVLDRALDHAVLLAQVQDYQKDLEARVLARVQELQQFHEEVLKLNELLAASQQELDEAPLIEPFLAHLRARYRPAQCLGLLPTAGDDWQPLGAGPEAPAPRPLPPPSALVDPLEWGWAEGLPEGHLIPLRGNGLTLGAIYLGFQERDPFHPDEPAFVLWRKQLEAALLGLRRTRDQLGRARTSRLP